MTIRQRDWVCDACHNPSSTLHWLEGLRICRHCYRAITGELEDRTTIPEGCEMRFLFAYWYWHQRRGKNLANRVVRLPKGQAEAAWQSA